MPNVFATTAIRKGALIIEYRGQRTTWDIVSSRPDSDPANPEHTFIFETSDGSVASSRLNAVKNTTSAPMVSGSDVPAPASNFKVTTPADLRLAESLLC